MELTVFAKKRTTTEGKRFYTYLTQLTRKEDGEHVSVQVKFPEGLAPKADDCRYIHKKSPACHKPEILFYKSKVFII